MTSSPSTTSFQTLLRLLVYAKGYRGRIAWASFCTVMNQLFDIAPEILIGIAIDVVVNQEQSFVARFGFVTPEQQIYVLGGLTLGIWFGESLFQYLYMLAWRNLSQRLQSDLRQDAYGHMQQQDMAFFERQSSGQLIAILNDDVNQLERFLDGGATAMIHIVVSVIAVGAVFFAISPLIATFAFLPIPLIIWCAFFFMRRANPLYAEVRERVGQLASRLANNIGGMATIKSFTAEAREAELIKQHSEAYVEANRQAIAVSSAFIPVTRMAILSGFLVTFVLGGLMTLEGELNVGAYGVLVFLTQRLLWPLVRLAETVDLYERAMASTRRILNLIETPIEVEDHGQRSLPQPVRGELRFQGVSFQYPQSGVGVEEVSLRVAAGTTTALVGATGSGKSTLIKLLLRFYNPQQGEISLDGVPIQQLPLRTLREQIGLVSQEVFLFEGSIRANIAYGRADASEAEIIQAAQQAEAWEFIERLPQGLDTQVGERGIKLSGGQRQRLSFARALLKNPPVLILDEATSAVDNETEAAIQRSLRHIAHDRTLLMIAHRLSTIVHAEQILVLDKGRVIEQGSHQQLLSLRGAYWKQWQVQTGGEG